jgi:hypothetical protein
MVSLTLQALGITSGFLAQADSDRNNSHYFHVTHNGPMSVKATGTSFLFFTPPVRVSPKFAGSVPPVQVAR